MTASQERRGAGEKWWSYCTVLLFWIGWIVYRESTHTFSARERQRQRETTRASSTHASQEVFTGSPTFLHDGLLVCAPIIQPLEEKQRRLLTFQRRGKVVWGGVCVFGATQLYLPSIYLMVSFVYKDKISNMTLNFTVSRVLQVGSKLA